MISQTGHKLQAAGRTQSRFVKRISLWPAAYSLWLLVLPSIALAQQSPFNGLEVLPADSTGHYRILIGGHFHGESTNRSGYPAATLLANLDTINSLGVNLFLSTGDLFMDPVKDKPRYERSLFSKLKMPLFNAPGNHDRGGRDSTSRPNQARDHNFSLAGPGALDRLKEVMQISTARDLAIASRSDSIGSSNYSASLAVEDSLTARIDAGSSRTDFVLLDLESKDGSLSQFQLSALYHTLDQLSKSHSPIISFQQSLFIISHRPIWAEDDPQYSPLFKDNTRSLTGTNFQKDVYPLLEKIAERAHVYWISGSLGGSAPSSIFFQEHAKNITYIQCAIRDEPRDALLIADVYPDPGSGPGVKWSALSLTGQKLLAPEAYNAAWWREHVGKSEGFNWRLLPYLVKTSVLRKEFWWGVVGGVLVLMLFRRLYRR